MPRLNYSPLGTLYKNLALWKSSNVGKDERKRIKGWWMDSVTMAIGALLNDLRDQVGDRLSQRKCIYVVSVDNDFMTYNQSLLQ